MIGMFLFGIFMAVMDYISTRQYGDYEAQITNVLFIYALTVAILIPAFVSLFVGTEYSDGTIRNKMIIGHTRTCIYLSNLIVCSTAGLGFCLSYIVGVIVAGLLTAYSASIIIVSTGVGMFVFKKKDIK